MITSEKRKPAFIRRVFGSLTQAQRAAHELRQAAQPPSRHAAVSLQDLQIRSP
tara:strand:- start:648 stop:806 length:159 start_codon:yes stop_codon:yes gene_type:complete